MAVTDVAEQHERAVATLTGALLTFFADRQEWTVITRTRWQPLADFPNLCHTVDAMIVPAAEPLDWDVSRNCLGPKTRPVTVFDVVTKHSYDFDEFFDKGDELCQAGVSEYVVWDPTAECLRPSFQGWRKQESVLRRVRTCSHNVFFSATGFRMEIGESEVSLSPCGDPWLEEELFTCQGLLDAEVQRVESASAAVNGLTAKVFRLRTQLGRAQT